MNKASFQTTCYAKCIITGEHAVLHGAEAIAAPVSQYQFSLTYQPSEEFQLNADYEGFGGENLLLCFWPALERCLSQLGHSLCDISGKFLIKNSVPIGSGMGFSACMCVSIARWLHFMGWITEQEIFHFAHRCEDLFHGKSSGVDIMVVLKNKPIAYSINHTPVILDLSWEPNLYISSAGSGTATSKTIARTEHFWRANPARAEQLCKQMSEASKTIKYSFIDQALSINERQDSLQKSLHQAYACFSDWGLVQGGLNSHIAMLQQAGALAVKPTGSGGDGGHVLSLWETTPPKDLLCELIPVFQ